ncbi:hypothetical protein [Bartonella grahamii]
MEKIPLSSQVKISILLLPISMRRAMLVLAPKGR